MSHAPGLSYSSRHQKPQCHHWEDSVIVVTERSNKVQAADSGNEYDARPLKIAASMQIDRQLPAALDLSERNLMPRPRSSWLLQVDSISEGGWGQNNRAQLLARPLHSTCLTQPQALVNQAVSDGKPSNSKPMQVCASITQSESLIKGSGRAKIEKLSCKA